MAKDDLTISQDDLSDIFGGDIPAAAKIAEIKPAAKKEEPAKKPEYVEQPAKSPMIITTKAGEMALAEKIAKEKQAQKAVHEQAAPQELDADELTARAEQIRMEMDASAGAPAAAAADIAPENKPAAFPGYLDEHKLTDIFSMFEELRRVMKQELSAAINEKTVNNMLLRTLEKAALSSPLLKNANWDSTGRLREDGTIDTSRIIKNLEGFDRKTGAVDREVENALMSVFTLRVKSVKMGMGAPAFNSLKDKVMKRLGIIEAGYSKPAVNFIKEKIVVPGLKKGEEGK